MDSEPLHPPEKTIAQEIIQRALFWHERFDREVWKGLPSFHNREHVRSVIEAGDKLFQAAEPTDGPDPLGLRKDWMQWNSEHLELAVTFAEFWEATQMALSLHDIGNIAQIVLSYRENGQIMFRPRFLPAYMEHGAEKRSADIAKIILANINYSPQEVDKHRKFLALVPHLIEQTTLNEPPGSHQVGAVFMRIIDQLGTNVCRSDENQVALGLLYEIYREYMLALKQGRGASLPMVNPNQHMNFLYDHFKPLVVSETGKELLSVWNVNETCIPERDNSWSREKMSVIDLISLVESRQKGQPITAPAVVQEVKV